MKFSRLVPAAAAALLLASAMPAQTIMVDLADDQIDVDPETATLADLPGPDGHISFSEAVIASNHTPGRQTIGFAVPTSEWTYLNWYYPGRAVVHAAPAFYWGVYDEVTIDGRTQTAFTGDTNPSGNEVVLLGGGPLYLAADDCTVTGLDASSIRVEGARARVLDNSLLGLDLYGAGGTLVSGNTGGGYVQIDQSDDNVVVGNTLSRVRVLGWMAGGRPARNNRIGGPTLAERNHILGQGYLDSHGQPNGFAVQLFESVGTVLENNWIGMTADGLAQGAPDNPLGVYIDSENHEVLLRDNRIAGIRALVRPPHSNSYWTGTAIQIGGMGSGFTLVGNKIGLDANDAPLLGAVSGIQLLDYVYGPLENVVIGGTGPGAGNELAGHLGNAITVAHSLASVRISGNSIHDNGGLGIDLVTDGFLQGVTPNDLLDVDSGGNGLQNFPSLRHALRVGRAVLVSGELASEPHRAYALEFFASPTLDPSGFGEGARFLGRTTVVTDGQGRATFAAQLASAAPLGWFVTATATDLARGATSEFSAGKRLTQLFGVH